MPGGTIGILETAKESFHFSYYKSELVGKDYDGMKPRTSSFPNSPYRIYQSTFSRISCLYLPASRTADGNDLRNSTLETSQWILDRSEVNLSHTILEWSEEEVRSERTPCNPQLHRVSSIWANTAA